MCVVVYLCGDPDVSGDVGRGPRVRLVQALNAPWVMGSRLCIVGA